MRIGIIGAENSHAAAIAKLLNVQKAIEGFEVTHLWGEAPEFVKKTIDSVAIPNVVEKSEEMLGQVDAVMIDHRDGKHHLDAARPFVENNVPVFIDKPLGTSLAACKEFLALRSTCGTPVVTMSSIPHQASVAEIKKRLAEIDPVRLAHFAGPGDPKSEYGGVFFYGIHQADLLVELFGTGARTVTSTLNGPTLTSVVTFPDDLNATITLTKAGKGFRVAAAGEGGEFHTPVQNDENVYLVTTKIFTEMFATKKEPFDDRRMLAPVALLEAMDASLAGGGPVEVAAV